MRRDDLALPDPPQADRPGARYKCGRMGEPGACSHGPSSKGACPFRSVGTSDEVCKPTLTWSGKRRRLSKLAVLVFVLAMIAVGVLFDSSWWAKPGKLTSAHAQLLANLASQGDSGVQNESCSTCHSDASLDSVGRNLVFSLSDHDTVDLTAKCIDCHHATTPPAVARMAHNLPPSARAEIRANLEGEPNRFSLIAMMGSAVDQESVSCAVCHREHQGTLADLTAMADAQCQSCHAVQFDSFSGNHPDFSRYPTPNESAVAFNHASHFQKHFPESEGKLTPGEFANIQDCKSCHAIDAGGDTVLRVAYETCATCHDEAIKVASTSVNWFALPTVPAEAFSSDGTSKWPDAATGWFDGRLSPLMQLMLRSDGLTDEQLKQLRGGDLSGLDGENAADLKLGRQLAVAMAGILRDVAADGQMAIESRLSKAGVAESVIERLLSELSPQLIDSATGTWFSPTPSSPRRFDASGKLLTGGWYRDDLTMALSYRGRGHQDEVIRGLVELAASLPVDDLIGKQLHDLPSVQACTQCHVKASQIPDAWVTNDLAKRTVDRATNRLTRFHHGPHLTSKQGGGCVDCHRLQTKSSVMVNLVGVSPVDSVPHLHGFSNIRKADCLSCHGSSVGSDSCVTCHDYHAH